MATLESHVIVVTGGDSGTGLGSTLVLLERGATVWVCDLGHKPAHELKPHMETGKVVFRSCVDVTSRSQRTKFMDVNSSHRGASRRALEQRWRRTLQGTDCLRRELHSSIEVRCFGCWPAAKSTC